MRKLYRPIARARMRKAGLRRINRPLAIMAHSGPTNIGSFFARNWRRYCLANQPKED